MTLPDPTPAAAAGPTRRAVLGAAAAATGVAATGAAANALAGCSSRPEPDSEPPMTPPSGTRMPVLFVGHGSPMNAIEDNVWSRAFAALADDLPRPRAILAISAHWYVEGTWLCGDARPRTIHDFGGFPQALFEVEYPAPGDRDLAVRVAGLLRDRAPAADLSADWGLDHGTWSVLRRTYPAADVPVVQLSIDSRLDARQHLELGRSLQQLRGDGVLVLGSGNITHNLRDAFARLQRGDTATPDWARGYDAAVQQAVLEHDTDRIAAMLHADPAGRTAHPYPDHWWPLVYCCGAATRDDAVRFPIEGFDMGSLSMRAVRFG